LDKMTIFYNTRLGVIKEMAGGVQSFDWFGAEAEDYSQIYDLLIVDEDTFIWQNYQDMVVTDGLLKLNESTTPSKYL